MKPARSRQPAPQPATGRTPAEVPALTPALRRFLYVTVCLAGAAVLIIEILGAKMLAPYVGTSHFVWTAQIAVTLISLAAGYWAGGHWVDRTPRLHRLFIAYIAVAIALPVAAWAREPVAYWALQFPLPVAALVASAILFFIPLTLLAMTGPFLARLMTSNLRNVGGQVGMLSGLSTLGSVAGTTLIGYFLLPLFSNTAILCGVAAILAALSCTYFACWHRSASVTVPLAAAAIGLAGLTLGAIRSDRLADNPDAVERFRANSNFGLLQVIDSRHGPMRACLNDLLTQNTYDTASGRSLSLFTYMLHGLARGYSTNLQSALCIGLGIGIVPRLLAADGATVDAVEINPAVPALAERFFDFHPTNVHVTIGDGRQFLNAPGRRYDTIILDAYLGDGSPVHLMTVEAFQAMKRRLEPGGTLVINSFCRFEPGRDFFAHALRRTLGKAFATVVIHATGNGNVFFVASNRPSLTLGAVPDPESVHPRVRAEVERCYRSIVPLDDRPGVVMTDDFNPVDFHDARNREEIRRALAFTLR